MNLLRISIVGGFTVSYFASLSASSLHAQETPPSREERPESSNESSPQRPPTSDFRQPGQGFGRGFGGRFGMRALFTPQNALDSFLMILGEANLTTSFNLTRDQKEKITDIRAAFGRSLDAWRRTNGADLADMQAELRDLMGYGNYNNPSPTEDRDPDGTKRQKLVDSIREVVATAPDGEQEIQRIRAVLTPAQAEQIDTRVLQSQMEAERRRSDWFDNSGGDGQRVDDSPRARGE